MSQGQLRDLDQATTVTSSPSKEPIKKELLRTHIQYDLNDPETNTWLDLLIQAARQWAETFTGRSFIKQSLLLTLDDFPGDEIILPRPPLISVSSVKFIDTDSTTTTVSSSKYHVNTDDEPGLVVLKDDKDWPDGTPKTTQAVEVRYDGGYGSARSDVPGDIRTAILQLVAHWFQNRSNVTKGEGVPREVPMTVKSLLYPYRITQRA